MDTLWRKRLEQSFRRDKPVYAAGANGWWPIAVALVTIVFIAVLVIQHRKKK